MAVWAFGSSLLPANLTPTTKPTPYDPPHPPPALIEAPARSKLPAEAPTASTKSETRAKDSLDAWLTHLMEKESNGSSTVKVLDVNGAYSHGCFQFQMRTWLSYGKEFGATEANIYNCALQRQVARAMIEENPRNWKHWGYTVLQKGVGLPPL